MIEKAQAINCSPKGPVPRTVCYRQFDLIKSMFKNFSARAAQYSKYWNDFADDDLTATGGNIMRVDFHKLFKEIAKDPNKYGFSKKLLAVSCPLDDKGEAVHAQHCHSKDGKGFKPKDDDGYAYAFSDPLHPSPEMQSIMNDYTVSVYDAPIQVLSLGSELAGFSQDSQSTLDSRFEQFHAGKHRFHAFSLFLGSDNHVKDLENDTEIVPHDALTIGEDYQFSDNAMIGVLFSHSIGYQRPFANFHYSAKGIALSAFGALDLFDHAYVNADIAYARMSFSNINRDIKLGDAVRTETSAAGTSGIYWGVRMAVGYDFPFSPTWTIGPMAKLSYGHVFVNGYAEDGYARHATEETTSTSMHFTRQRCNLREGSLGLRLNGQFSRFNIYGKVSYKRKLGDNTCHIHAAISGTGTQFSPLQGRQDKSSIVLVAGGNMQLDEHSVAFANVRRETQQYRLNLGFTYTF